MKHFLKLALIVLKVWAIMAVAGVAALACLHFLTQMFGIAEGFAAAFLLFAAIILAAIAINDHLSAESSKSNGGRL